MAAATGEVCILARRFCHAVSPLRLRQLLAAPRVSARQASSLVQSTRVPSSPAAISASASDEESKSTQSRDVCASMRQVKTSPMKLNLVAKLIRGMSITDALAQIKFCEKKPSKFVEMTLLDAQRRAEQTHNMEPLDLHVAESYVGKGSYLKRIRYHGRGRFGIMHKYYAHYFVRLRQGPAPPKRKRKKEDHKSFLTRKLIQAGPRSIPNSL